MKRLIAIAIITTFFLACSETKEDSKPQFLHTEGQMIVDGNNENVLLRGMGLGGYMLQEGYMLKVPFSGQQYVIKEHIQELIGKEKTEEFYTKWRNNFIQKADIDSLKSWGFNSIRLPMHYNLYTLAVDEEPVKGENTWLEQGFSMTDSLVSWCRSNDMYLILDMHAAPGGQGHDVNISDRDPSKPSLWESQANQDKLIALWQELAKRYKDEPVIGAYDLINEPNWSFEGRTEGVDRNGVSDTLNKPLKKLLVEITQAIREVDTNHIVIIEGNGWGNNYNGILPPWDDNMVLSFHKYWNYNDQEAIQTYLDYREKYNIPIWLGESGENSNAWYADAIGLMEENNIGWCWWPLKKLGSNNPLQIKVNPGYQDILNYWNEKTTKPDSEEAYNAFMQLAENTKIENCLVRPDVIDAMMRQPGSDSTQPYVKTIIPNDTILAVNYDLGNNDHAYKDSDVANYWVSTGGDRESWNNGFAYRNDGVDIFKENDLFYVGDFHEEEWLQYTFQAESAGSYEVRFEVSSIQNPGKIKVKINGQIAGEVDVPPTSGNWEWINIENLQLNEGENRLIIKVEKGGFDFKTIQFNKA